MQIIIPYVKSNSGFDELKYAVRSIEEKFKDDFELIIIGEKPEWLNEKATFIPHKRLTGIHLPNCQDACSKMNTLILSAKIGDEFIITYDDIYFLKKIGINDLRKIYALKRKTVDGTSKYARILKNTLAALRLRKMTARNFETHLPRLINKEKMLKTYQTFLPKKNRLLHFSLYFNHHHFDDKIITISHTQNHIKAGFYGKDEKDFSYSNDLTKSEIKALLRKSHFLNHNNSGLTPALREIIEEKFPNPSSFEKIEEKEDKNISD